MKKIFGLISIAAFLSGGLFVSCSNDSNDMLPIIAALTTSTKAYNELPAGTNGTAGTGWTYVTFGRWPQTIKAASVEVDESVTETHGMFTYCKGSDGEWYVKAKENAQNVLKYSDGTDVAFDSANSYKWFKVEPIKWRVLTSDYNGTGKKLLLAENILMPCAYFIGAPRIIGSIEVYQNNYEHSKIRAYLNGLSYQIKEKRDSVQTTDDSFSGKGFLQTAFTDAQQAAIFTTSVDNSARSTNPDSDAKLWNNGDNENACDNTHDKVFLLSEQEVTKESYGFALYNQAESGNSRIRDASDYALAAGVYKNGAGGLWLLRSPRADYQISILFVGTDGLADVVGWVNISQTYDFGVVPALCVD